MQCSQNCSGLYPCKQDSNLCSGHSIRSQTFVVLGYLLFYGVCSHIVPLLPAEVSNTHSLALLGNLIVLHTFKNRLNSFCRCIMFTFAVIPILLAYQNNDRLRYAELMSVHFYLIVVNYCPSWFCYGMISSILAVNWVLFYSYNPLLIITQRDLTSPFNSRTPEEIRMFAFTVIFSGIHSFMMKYKHCRALDELAQAKKRLEETYAELEGTNRKLKESLEAKDNLILSFSHELKNPMNLLVISSKILSESLADGRLQQIARDSYITAEKMSHLLNNIFDTAKLDQGALEICTNRVNIRNLLDSFWKIAQEMITKKRLTGELEIARSVPKTIKIDETRLTQMLFNLISNAVKYTEKGRVTLKVDFERTSPLPEDSGPRLSHEGNIRESNAEKHNTLSPYAISRVRTLSQLALNPGFQSHGSSETSYLFNRRGCKIFSENLSSYDQYSGVGVLTVCISDTGCGIDPNIKSQINNRNFMQKLRFDGRRIGTGLGLWVTSQICKSMGGSLEINRENTGTTAKVLLSTIAYGTLPTLPSSFQLSLQCTKSKSFADPKSFNLKGGTSLRAMIVEDDPYNQYIHKVILEQMGLEVVYQAMNGSEAFEFYMKHSEELDVITMDLDMPIMKGDACCEAIRQFEAAHKKKPCPIVIVSAYSTDLEISRCTNQNGSIRANYFVRKPMSTILIQGIFDDIMKEKEAQRKIHS